MSANLFRPVEPMEMSDTIITNEAPQNARIGQYIGMQRKMTVLFILTVMNITVTVALISFIALYSMKNQTENAQINTEMESLKKFVGKMEKQHGNGGQQNTDTGLVKAIETKLNELVEQQKKNQNFIDVLKDRFGNDGQQQNTEKDMVKAIETKVIALEEHQKKEEIFISVLKDRFGNELLKAVHPDIRKNISENFSIPKQNCWDVNASHSDLEIFGSESLKVHYKGDGSGRRSVFAKHPILFSESGIFYFEIKIRVPSLAVYKR